MLDGIPPVRSMGSVFANLSSPIARAKLDIYPRASLTLLYAELSVDAKSRSSLAFLSGLSGDAMR